MPIMIEDKSKMIIVIIQYKYKNHYEKRTIVHDEVW